MIDQLEKMLKLPKLDNVFAILKFFQIVKFQKYVNSSNF